MRTLMGKDGWNGYNIEIGMYENFREDFQQLNIRLPKYLYSVTDSTDGGITCDAFVLLLEYLDPWQWTVQDQVTGMSEDSFKLVVSDNARRHASFYRSPK